MLDHLPSVLSRHSGLGHASAGLGVVAWLVLLVALPSATPQRTIVLLLLFAVLVCTPLALALAATPAGAGRPPRLYRFAQRAQPAAALLAVAAFVLPGGPTAAALAVPWLLFTGVAALFGLARLLPRGPGPLAEWCVVAGLLYLSVGGAWLVLSRLGANPLGFGDTIVLLTAVHFHYAGLAAPVLTGMVGRVVPPGRSAARHAFGLVAVGAIAGPPLLAAGITLSPPLESAAAVLQAGSLIGLAGLTAFVVVPRLRAPLVQGLLLVSALSATVAMAFAIVYGLGAVLGVRLLTISQMVAMHGWLNAVGFVGCGLLAWTLAYGLARPPSPGSLSSVRAGPSDKSATDNWEV
jgi:hypothetical protein